MSKTPFELTIEWARKAALPQPGQRPNATPTGDDGHPCRAAASSKIRHAGLYGSVRADGLLERARAIVGVCKKPKKKEPSNLERLEQACRICPKCGSEIWRTPVPASTRAPPGAEPC